MTPTVTATSDTKDPHITRWIIKLPRANLPITRLTCTARTPLFQRDILLYEELSDDRGDKYSRALGGATWVQTPNQTSKQFALILHGSPSSDTLVLETHNGDNPPIELEKFQAFYPATRMLFKAQPADELLLYYGNPQVASPRYDLSRRSSRGLTGYRRTTQEVLGRRPPARPGRRRVLGDTGGSRGGATDYHLAPLAPNPATGIIVRVISIPGPG